MSDSGRPFDFGQLGGAGTPHNPPVSADSSGAGSPNPFAGSAGKNVHSGFSQDDSSAGSSGTNFNYDGAAPLRPVGAPVVWLFGSMAAAVIALVLALIVGGDPVMAVTAWILAGPVAIALVAVFSFQDTRARTAALYSSSDFATWLYRGVIILSLIAVVVSALRIADWVGRI